MIIRLDNVTKKYGNSIALDNINLQIQKGECYVFLGPNGAGKTTTIKLITGLLKPTNGKVYVKGYDIEKDYIQAKRYISYIPDVPFLYDKLTGREFLIFTAKIFGISNEDTKKRISALTGQFGLAEYQYRLIEEYSHGMKQRLVMCAALIHDAEIIMVDEPMVALDPAAIKMVKDIFRQKTREGVTIFMSTHTLSIAEEIGDRIGIINKGRIIAEGTIEEIKRKTSTSGTLEEIYLGLTAAANDEK